MISWKTQPISELMTQITTGSTPPTVNSKYYGGTIPWFTPGDIGKRRNLIKSSRYISQEAVNSAVAPLCGEQTLLITCIGDIGRVGILNSSASFNQQITAIRFNDEIDINYAYYWFLKNKFLLTKEANQAILPILNNSKLKGIPFCYPPLNEQIHLAVILEKADHHRQQRCYALELTDSYLQSVFLEMFGDSRTNYKGWDSTIIEEVISESQYGTSEKNNSSNKGYPILGMGNITYAGNVDLSSFSYVELPAKEFQKLKLSPGDVIFNRTNSEELVGKTAVWNLNKDAVLASYLVKLKLKEELVPEYFVTLLNTKYYKQLFQKRCKKAVNQANISPTLLKSFQ